MKIMSSAQNTTKTVDNKDLVYPKAANHVFNFTFSGICSSSEIIYLLLDAIFLSASQTAKSLTNHLVNLLGFEMSSK